jgi:hypothetical protein
LTKAFFGWASLNKNEKMNDKIKKRKKKWKKKMTKWKTKEKKKKMCHWANIRKA